MADGTIAVEQIFTETAQTQCLQLRAFERPSG